MFTHFLLIGTCLIASTISASMDPRQSLVTSLKEPTKNKGRFIRDVDVVREPEIYQMHIKTVIANRYARTVVASRVRNFAAVPQESVFSLILPDTAFISGFTMEVDDKNYTAYVKEKAEAKREYDQAVSSGQSAAHVGVTARDSNHFTITVNIEPQKKAAFYLTYEQLLYRQNGYYEQVININKGQPVKDLNIETVITENRRLIDVKVLPLRSGNEITADNPELDPRVEILHQNSSTIIIFHPNVERQRQVAEAFGNKNIAQFVVQYDVERDPHGGEVLLQDGYFVHFFAPTHLKPLEKQVNFILDTSGSMRGQKIEQLIEAMVEILDQLNEQDSFNLIEFNSDTNIWDLNSFNDRWQNGNLSKSFPATKDNIKKAKRAVKQMKVSGTTNMYTALKVGLDLVEADSKRQPMILFLTDGDPTDLPANKIITKITERNTGVRKTPIFALSFGDGADKNFLQQLALQNLGFSRHIYEAADASLQLQNFYKQISSPVLSNVTFKYDPAITSLTKTEFAIHFDGSEIVVAGWCGTKPPNSIINGNGRNGTILFEPTIVRSISNVERLWAYLTISQLLKKSGISENKNQTFTKTALDLALKYQFVTPISSLVVVKPNENSTVNSVNAVKDRFRYRASGAVLIDGPLIAAPFYLITFTYSIYYVII